MPPKKVISTPAERPPGIDLRNFDFDKYITKCPSLFGNEGHSPKWLQKNVIDGKRLLMFPLEELNSLYYNDSKLSVISKHRHIKDEGTSPTFSLDNVSFYVTIGTKDGYKEELDKPKSKANNKSTPSNCIALKGKGTSSTRGTTSYEAFFVDFYNSMFQHNNTDKLEKSLLKENMLSICIFA